MTELPTSTDQAVLREQLVELLTGAHAHAAVMGALAGLEPALRGRRPGASAHSIYEELEHMRLAQEDILRYTVDPKWVPPAWPEGYWPRQAEPTEAQWKDCIEGFERGLGELVALDPQAARSLGCHGVAMATNPIRTVRALAMLAALGFAACSTTEPTQLEAEFVVSVLGEMFVMRVRDPETIRLAREHVQGRNQRFPVGPLRRGDGGFNAPWSWHFDPVEVRLTEAAIEVCDGTPSYVESHLADFPSYCPWAARIVAER